MSYVDKMLKFNTKFVSEKTYESYRTTKLPNKKIAVLSCMDTRLTYLLPAALNFKNGDIKMIKNAGGMVIQPFGSVMRSLVVAIYTLGVKEIFVIGHHKCGMQGLDTEAIIQSMRDHGISRETIDTINNCGINLNNWLRGFNDVESSVINTLNKIRSHPLIPEEINVLGFLMDPITGKLDKLEEPSSQN